jgi:poly(3-hydroxybutyrate) depolymerase
MEKQPSTTIGLGLSWGGALATWLAQSHTVLALAATVVAITASVFTIRAQRATARLRNLEIAEHQTAAHRNSKCPLCGQHIPSTSGPETHGQA